MDVTIEAVRLVPVRHPVWTVWLGQRAEALVYDPDRIELDAAAVEAGVHCDRMEEVRCLRAFKTLIRCKRTTAWILAMHEWYRGDRTKLMRAADTLLAKGELFDAELLAWSIR